MSTSDAVRRFGEALREALDCQPEAKPHAGDIQGPTAGTPLARRFDDAFRRGLDPVNADLSRSVRTSRNTGYSEWLMEPCPVCRHTIREGDQVWLEQRNGKIEAVHDSSELPCHSGAKPTAPKLSSGAAAFSAAFRVAYPGIPVLKVVRLRPGHPLLSQDYLNGPARCRGCGHTFRPFERVAFCPCRPLAPKNGCHFAAHMDPAVSQLCFELLADPTRKHCPMDFSPR